MRKKTYWARVLETIANKEDYVSFLIKQKNQYLLDEDVKVVVDLYSLKSFKEAPEIKALFEAKVFDYKSVLIIKEKGVSYKWLANLLVELGNFEALVEAHLFEPYVKKGLYLNEIFKYAKDYSNSVYFDDDNLLCALQKMLGREFEFDGLDVFYLYQKDFLLEKGCYDPFLERYDVEPLLERKLYKKILFGTVGDCACLYDAGQLDLILSAVKDSVVYYVGESAFQAWLECDIEKLIGRYRAIENDAVCNGNFHPNSVLCSEGFAEIVSFLESKGVDVRSHFLQKDDGAEA